MVRSASCIAQIRSWIALSRPVSVAARSCSSTSRCDGLGAMACSIRSINALASAAADVLLQRSADETGAFAGDAASLTWSAAARRRGPR